MADDIKRLTDRIIRVESLLIGLTIGAIAYGDYLAGPDLSLGYIYLVPLSYSALTHRLRTTLLLVVVCVALRQWFGPLERSTWLLFGRDWVLTAVFLSVVTALYRLGRARQQLFQKARRQRDELVREVELAAQVQRQLLSQNVPPSDRIDISARNWPAKVVGGDYYDFIPVSDDLLGIVIADVSGKGLPAALLMPAVQISLRALAKENASPEALLRSLNTTLYEVTDRASFATLFYAVLDMGSGCLRYANAGHPPPLLFASRGECSRLEAGGLPVGLLPGSRYQSGQAVLEGGGVLVLYTDGVIETRGTQDEDFDISAVRSVIAAHRQGDSSQIVHALHSAVTQFAAPSHVFDDLTAIAVKIPPVESP
ncbi:MAG TPA: PP2C family protein-serine/threonine phosphatase [Acidobacteriota bacterium]|nr:PP2C family protein-serine/threonine phosphatase [Acidobacteriota bacterium]